MLLHIYLHFYRFIQLNDFKLNIYFSLLKLYFYGGKIFVTVGANCFTAGANATPPVNVLFYPPRCSIQR